MEPILPRKRRAKSTSKAYGSVAGVVDKSTVLAMVEQLQADASSHDSSLSDEERIRQALSIAHDEDVFGWRDAISQVMHATASGAEDFFVATTSGAKYILS